MHPSIDEQTLLRAKALWCATLCAAAVMMTTSAYAGDDKGRRDKRGEHRSWAQERHHGRRPHDHDGWNRHAWRDQHWDGRHEHDWRRNYERTGYYADEWPSLHRYGRRCGDRRHYHGVHYHVTASDYYDHYYPRYRYYGARPANAHASVIITLPLF